MTIYPLETIDINEAKTLQFKIVDAITHKFSGKEVLNLGDLGVVAGIGKPSTTIKAEEAVAKVFGAEAALFVRGSGTGAIRFAIAALLPKSRKVLVHNAPIYPTTKQTLEMMNVEAETVDFNNENEVFEKIESSGGDLPLLLVQYTRQKPDDFYNPAGLIRAVRAKFPSIKIVSDDNYAAFKVKEIGSEAGGNLATFSCFKTLGPEGVGILIGDKESVKKAATFQYSGGSQVQGFEAMAALRGMIYAPVALAIQSEVADELVARLNSGELADVKHAFIANAQSKVVLVEFDDEIAEKILEITPNYGAASHPVGSESIYEFVPMMYRISGTFRANDPSLERRMIRINPMRSGADTIIRILKSALSDCREEC